VVGDGDRHQPVAPLCLLAEGRLAAGRRAEALALALLEEALGLVEGNGERAYEAKVRLVRAEALLAGDREDREDRERGERALRMALDVARRQAERGERGKAHDLLAPVCSWFGEDLDTPDLRDGRALLGSLP
jgi:hypothetical protein